MGKKLKVAVFDIETDPFLYGRKPLPFACGLYDGDIYKQFWGGDCIEQFIIYCESLTEKHLIYAHNGGKFDFMYLLESKALNNPALIINGRIVKCGFIGQHEIRDSYAMIPIPLSAYKKDDADYTHFEKECREYYKDEILKYLKADCVYTFELIEKFHNRFGVKLTIGGTASCEIAKLHQVVRTNKIHDALYRPYYFGGRVECFKYGTLDGDWKIYDVNSMYPHAMKSYSHPIGTNYIHFGREIRKRMNIKTGKIEGFTGMYFIAFIGSNKGALPIRTKTGLDFNCPYGEFRTTSHELKVALKYGLIKIDSIVELAIPCNEQSYGDFVDKYGAEKIAGKLAGNIADEIFAKLILNSAYGKYGTDPDNFKDWFIRDSQDDDVVIKFDEWFNNKINAGLEPQLEHDLGRFEFWSCPANDDRGYYDVAIAASVTSAARSILLEALQNAIEPIYCDTDSIICKNLSKVAVHDSALGAWKLEGVSKRVHVAGKKMYCAEGAGKNGKDKIASKGAKLKRADIEAMCRGEVVQWQNDAPNMRKDGSTKFVQRNLRRTIDKSFS